LTAAVADSVISSAQFSISRNSGWTERFNV
jgi:hypothetical protein